jgi:Pentapeptide repeats (8 copies)
VAPMDAVIEAIVKGQRPEAGELLGVKLDGKRLPRREKVVPWNLTEMNLRGSVFTRLDLDHVVLKGADLSGAVFRNVNLGHADFRDASAAGAVFEDVNLAYADFSGADLRGAVFSFANLADICFKDADMKGAAVNGVRFSMNGVTHTLGLKEALNHRYRNVGYPFAAGVSGDAFWLTYGIDTGALAWGGHAPNTLSRGLSLCGFASEMVTEFDVEEAWRRLTGELAAKRGVITPVQIGGPLVTGTGFGGSEWVYVSDFDLERNAVRIRCLLSDNLWMPWGQFISSWCVRHPLDPDPGQIVYTLCVVGDRTAEVTPGEAVLAGIRNAVEILDTGECPEQNAVCGIPVYDLLLRDLETDPSLGDEGCTWLGLGLRHHHGSRWAVRDFLRQAEGHLKGGEEHLALAIEAYEQVLSRLGRMIRILPVSIDSEEAGATSVRRFLENRDEAARCLREARAAESRGRDALALLGETATAS